MRLAAEIHSTSSVFTPTSPARKNFVKRAQIIKRLKRGLETEGTQIVLYGHTGSGKTTLLLNTLEKEQYSFVKTNCTEKMSFEQLMANVYLEIDKKLQSKQVKKESEGNEFKLGIPKIVQVSISSKSEETDEQTALSELDAIELALAKTLGEQGLIWVVEDFHKLKEDVKKQLVQMMKVFMDKADEYPKLKVVALGAKNTAREVIDLDDEMQRRVNEIYVPLMTNEEIEKIVINGCKLLNISIDPNTICDVKKYSHGVASICHQLCKLMCEFEDIESTDDGQNFELHYEHFGYATAEYMEIVSDSLKANFQYALKVPDASKVIRCLSNKPTDGIDFDEFLEYINDSFDSIEMSEIKLKGILDKLTTSEFGNVIRYDEKHGLYSFRDPFYKTFADIYMRSSESNKRLSQSKKNALMDTVLRNMRFSFEPSSALNSVSSSVSSESFVDLDDKKLLESKFQEDKGSFKSSLKS